MVDGEIESRDVEKATFAGGCFWCMEEIFAGVPGVITVMPGYTGGHTLQPTYEAVMQGNTGHVEAVQLSYDAQCITYDQLLEIYWRNIDPTTGNRQFCDVGTQYRPVIFYHDDQQRRLAAASKATLQRDKPFAGDVVVDIAPLDLFYPAEDYHRGFYRRNPLHYQRYRRGCGRDERLRALWHGEGVAQDG